MDRVGTLIALRNQPGRFAVLDGGAAQAIIDGQMKLYQTKYGTVEVETISRNRRDLNIYDPHYRVIFLAVEGEGRLVVETRT
jgi:hypothetical protein